jgi:pyruvate carboxylase
LSAEDEKALAASPRRTLNRLLFPGPTKDYEDAVEDFSELIVLTTRQFLHGLVVGQEHEVPIERGKTLLMALHSIGEPDEHGMRQVVCLMNGQMRVVTIRDHAVTSTVAVAERADTKNPGHVPAPFAGVVTLTVAEGDVVTAGQPVATIEAMKMEAAITTPVAGTVQRLAIHHAQAVEGGDLLVVVA